MRAAIGIVAALCLAACGGAVVAQQAKPTLAEARAGHTTALLQKTRSGDPVPVPPKGTLDLVSYISPAGKMAAYLSAIPKDGKKHPAIIWISGGDCNTIGDFWSPQSPDNDQSAAAFRKAGVVTLYPSLRGGNRNPAFREGLYGEVDDILAARNWLAAQPGVDPARIYLGGHSTGGTLVLLVAEIDAGFRATFAFGPVSNPSDYGDVFPLPVRSAAEVRLRSPGLWLDSIRSPVFVFEGEDGNAEDLQQMGTANRNPLAHFWLVPRASHFSILAPATALIAKRIVADTGAASNIAFTEAELNRLIR